MAAHRQPPGIPQFGSIEELQRWIATADGSVISELFESLRPTDPARLEEMARVVDEALDLAKDQASAHAAEGLTPHAVSHAAR